MRTRWAIPKRKRIIAWSSIRSGEGIGIGIGAET